MMSELHADHFFLAVDGLDPQAGPSTPDVLEAQLNAVMIRMAKEVTVITDATKFGRRSLSIIGDIASIDRVITDDRVTEETVCQLRKIGIEVQIV
jgi:DeoR family transcriptional regulator of aga operon